MRIPEQSMGLGRSLENATVIELVSSIAPSSFGLGYAALRLAAALHRRGVNAYLVSVDQEDDTIRACEESGFPRGRFIRGSLLGPSRLRLAPQLIRRISNTHPDGQVIVHLHGLWTYVSFVAGVLRKKWNCPLVVSPHGSLEPYALRISPHKKALASLLYERKNLLTASCLWALSKQEEASIRSYGYKGRVAIIPNGVDDEIACSPQELAEFRRTHNIGPELRVLLFLSRIARKKNLPLLLKHFVSAVKTSPGWVLLIAGSDEDGHIHEVRTLIREVGGQNSVRIIGQVHGKAKACAFASASVFVLPSHSEGLPIAVLEAMEYGKPVLVTDGWTLPVETSARFGWRVPADGSTFGAALMEAMSSPEEVLSGMGQAGRAIVRQNFRWDSVASQAESLYESVLATENKADSQR